MRLLDRILIALAVVLLPLAGYPARIVYVKVPTLDWDVAHTFEGRYGPTEVWQRDLATGAAARLVSPPDLPPELAAHVEVAKQSSDGAYLALQAAWLTVGDRYGTSAVLGTEKVWPACWVWDRATGRTRQVPDLTWGAGRQFQWAPGRPLLLLRESGRGDDITDERQWIAVYDPGSAQTHWLGGRDRDWFRAEWSTDGSSLIVQEQSPRVGYRLRAWQYPVSPPPPGASPAAPFFGPPRLLSGWLSESELALWLADEQHPAVVCSPHVCLVRHGKPVPVLDLPREPHYGTPATADLLPNQSGRRVAVLTSFMPEYGEPPTEVHEQLWVIDTPTGKVRSLAKWRHNWQSHHALLAWSADDTILVHLQDGSRFRIISYRLAGKEVQERMLFRMEPGFGWLGPDPPG